MRRRNSSTIHAKDAATLSGERDGATGGTATNTANTASAVAMSTTDQTATNDSAAADADDAERGAT